jgi:hypothetical protein
LSNTATIGGGGLYVLDGSVTLEGTRVRDNTAAGEGGGLALRTSSAWLDSNMIQSNIAGTEGGGLHFSGFTQHRLVLTNNVFLANYAPPTGGAGLSVAGGRSHFLHTTLDGIVGSRPYYGVVVKDFALGGPWLAVAAFTNTIVADHVVGLRVNDGNTVTLRGVLWHATASTVSHGSGASVTIQDQWVGDPAFFPDGYHLGPQSAAINRGIAGGLSTDFDGDARPVGPAPDLGADEAPWQWWLRMPLLLRN